MTLKIKKIMQRQIYNITKKVVSLFQENELAIYGKCISFGRKCCSYIRNCKLGRKKK